MDVQTKYPMHANTTDKATRELRFHGAIVATPPRESHEIPDFLAPRYNVDFFCKNCNFWGVKGGGFFFLQTLLFQNLLLRYYKKTYFTI